MDFVVVFMGSKKYQNDNDFDAYVTDHGGSSNAFTDCEQVKYMFVSCMKFGRYISLDSKFIL